MTSHQAAVAYKLNPTPENLERVVKHSYKLVASYVGRYSHIIDFDDLLGVGLRTIPKALEGFDPTKAQFSTHLGHKVRGEVSHYVRTNAHLIKIPGWYFEAISKYTTFVNQYQKTHGGILPNEEECAKALRCRVEEIDKIKKFIKNKPVSLSSNVMSSYGASDIFQGGSEHSALKRDLKGNAWTDSPVTEYEEKLEDILVAARECKTAYKLSSRLGCDYIEAARILKLYEEYAQEVELAR